MAHRVAPPTDALRHLRGVDYADAFRISSAPPAPASQWAMLSLSGGPELPRRAFGALVWHGVLGFDLAAPDAPGTLVGWRIAVDEPHEFVLACDGTVMEGRMVFAVADDAVTWTTALRFHSARAKPIWAAAQHAHRAMAPRLLAAAARRVAR